MCSFFVSGYMTFYNLSLNFYLSCSASTSCFSKVKFLPFPKTASFWFNKAEPHIASSKQTMLFHASEFLFMLFAIFYAYNTIATFLQENSAYSLKLFYIQIPWIFPWGHSHPLLLSTLEIAFKRFYFAFVYHILNVLLFLFLVG